MTRIKKKAKKQRVEAPFVSWPMKPLEKLWISLHTEGTTMRHIATAGCRGPAGKQFVSVDLQRRTATPSGETMMPTASLMSNQRRFCKLLPKAPLVCNNSSTQTSHRDCRAPKLRGTQKVFSESNHVTPHVTRFCHSCSPGIGAAGTERRRPAFVSASASPDARPRNRVHLEEPRRFDSRTPQNNNIWSSGGRAEPTGSIMQ